MTSYSSPSSVQISLSSLRVSCHWMLANMKYGGFTIVVASLFFFSSDVAATVQVSDKQMREDPAGVAANLRGFHGSRFSAWWWLKVQLWFVVNVDALICGFRRDAEGIHYSIGAWMKLHQWWFCTVATSDDVILDGSNRRRFHGDNDLLVLDSWCARIWFAFFSRCSCIRSDLQWFSFPTRCYDVASCYNGGGGVVVVDL